MNCVKDMKDVVRISNKANMVDEMRVNLVAEDLEIEKSKNNLIFFGIKENGVLSDKDAICEILSEGLKLEGSRHVEEESRVGRFAKDKIQQIRVKVVGSDSKREILQRSKTEFWSI